MIHKLKENKEESKKFAGGEYIQRRTQKYLCIHGEYIYIWIYIYKNVQMSRNNISTITDLQELFLYNTRKNH